jgi:hypothetical protein
MSDSLRNISILGLVGAIWGISSVYVPNKAGYEIILTLLSLTVITGLLSYLYKENRKILKYSVMNTTILISVLLSYYINSIIPMDPAIAGINPRYLLVVSLLGFNIILLLILAHSSKDRTFQKMEQDIQESDQGFRNSVLRYLITINPQYQGELEIQTNYIKKYVQKYKTHGSVSKSLERKAQKHMERYVHIIVAVKVFSMFILYILISLLISSIYISVYSSVSTLFNLIFFSSIAMSFFTSLWFVIEVSEAESVPSPYVLFSFGFCFVILVYSDGIISIHPLHIIPFLFIFIISYGVAMILSNIILRNIYDLGVLRLKDDEEYQQSIEDLIEGDEFNPFGGDKSKSYYQSDLTDLQYRSINMRITSIISSIYELLSEKVRKIVEKLLD